MRITQQLDHFIELDPDSQYKRVLCVFMWDLRDLINRGAIAEQYARQITNFMDPHRFYNEAGELEDYYECPIEFDVRYHNELLMLIYLSCALHNPEECHMKPLVLV